MMLFLDTTSVLLNYVLYCLSKNPEARQELEKELDAIFGTGNETPEIQVEHLSKLKHLDATIKEVMRLFPSVPFNGRLSTKESMLGGYQIPKGKKKKKKNFFEPFHFLN
jgi:cytochrome P450 family 4 subfamily V